MKQLATSRYLGVSFVAETPSAVIDWLLDQASSVKDVALPVHLIPAHALAQVSNDPEFRDVLESDGLVIPDGRWLELLSRRREVPLHQLRGSDLFIKMCDQGRERALSHYFLGPNDSVLDALRSRLDELFPGILIAGMEVYPFAELDESSRATLTNRVRQSGASVVWMGISSPRQNKEARWIAADCSTVVISVGAAFEFVAGVKRSAPRWVQRMGIEWLFRLISEPKRLWRRYVFDSLRFVRLLWRHRHD